MIACISPSFTAYEETVNTLKYASRAKNIKRKVSKNTKNMEIGVKQYRCLVVQLRDEI